MKYIINQLRKPTQNHHCLLVKLPFSYGFPMVFPVVYVTSCDTRDTACVVAEDVTWVVAKIGERWENRWEMTQRVRVNHYGLW